MVNQPNDFLNFASVLLKHALQYLLAHSSLPALTRKLAADSKCVQVVTKPFYVSFFITM